MVGENAKGCCCSLGETIGEILVYGCVGWTIIFFVMAAFGSMNSISEISNELSGIQKVLGKIHDELKMANIDSENLKKTVFYLSDISANQKHSIHIFKTKYLPKYDKLLEILDNIVVEKEE